MNKIKILTIIFLFPFFPLILPAQESPQDTMRMLNIREVVISANRIPVTLQKNPGAVTLVTLKSLRLMPKGAGADEALQLVPGVQVDNQHDAERMHISIRGQGILTERGLRGIGVILDGIPLNDPSGFVPDLYDVDWPTVQRIEVLRGPSAGSYGSSGGAGILAITTRDGGSKPLGGTLSQTFGSNGYSKTLAGIGGSQGPVNYRVDYSRTRGDGYRHHQAFWSNKLYEKIIFRPSDKLSVTQIISHTDYFQQNPEGLNLGQLDDPRQANPDAVPFNEYQKTNRTTLGMTGKYTFNSMHTLRGYAFYRTWRYKETSNRAAEYRDHTAPGMGLIYDLHLGGERVSHLISVGTDLKWQTIPMYKLKSAADPQRQESLNETNLETDTLLANQIIDQKSAGIFLLYRLEAGRFTLLGNVRYDGIHNGLTDKMSAPDSSYTGMNFGEPSLRLGVSYAVDDHHTLFANWSNGFMPPSTEELAANPLGYAGFNTHLVPATARSIEAGSRGSIGKRIFYDVTFFLMHTENDFFRFKQSGRGNQEVFYGNAGNSRRYGIETRLTVEVMKNLRIDAAYTFADYRYTSAQIDPVYLDTNYVLTTPPEPGQYLPNSPKHLLFVRAAWSFHNHFTASISTNIRSRWAVYTDARAYAGELDPAIYDNWQKGYALLNARLEYQWNWHKMKGIFSIAARNLTGADYIAFTEPDPDGNAYHPGPGREFFGTLTIGF